MFKHGNVHIFCSLASSCPTASCQGRGWEVTAEGSLWVAAEAYRSAVEINQKDYRAWYGLGQAYELLGLPYYALHYFRRATQVRRPALSHVLPEIVGLGSRNPFHS